MRARYPEAELAADRAIHILGLSAGAIGALVMIARVTVSAGALTFSAVAIYLLALLAMLAASAAHNCRQARAGKELCRRLDHAAIFALIAGTYTPFTLTVLSGGLAIGVTAALWTAALGGVLTKLRYPLRFERLSIVVYLLFGWQGAVPRSAAVRCVARTDRCSYRDRGCAVFGRHSVSHLDEAAVPERDLARFRRPCGGLSLRGDLANRLAGGRQTLICLCLARRPE